MFPIRDDNPHFLTPYATYALIGLNVLVWVLVQGLGRDPALARSVCTLGLIPGELLGTVAAGTAFPIGPDVSCVIGDTSGWYTLPIGPDVSCVIGDTSGWYTLVTSMFMHGGWKQAKAPTRNWRRVR